MKIRYMHPLLWLALPFFSTPSCSSLTRTFKMEHRIFVRVPGDNPIKTSEVSNGWRFKHVVECPRQKESVQSQWYLAWRTDGKDRLTNSGIMTPWPQAHRMAPDLADATFKVLRAYPQLIEPGLVFKEKTVKPSKGGGINPQTGVNFPTLIAGDRPTGGWPSPPRGKDGKINPTWHLDDEHTQLASAREAVGKLKGNTGRSIKIGILDTGFDSRHHSIPQHLDDDYSCDAIQALRQENDSCENVCQIYPRSPGQSPTPGHGTGTLGILAGRRAKFVDPHHQFREGTVELGAAPDAEIVPVRIAPWVASLSTANLAYGIDQASRLKGCDVLSISHGGSPSMMWADAVNASYERGTAMFAAAGNYLPLPMPFPNRFGMIVPSSTVYPAAYRRVMGVTGVTADGKTYSTVRFPWLINTFRGGWMHGSYGADGVRHYWTDLLPWRDERERTDDVMLRIFNELRANPVAAYTPAIPWPRAGTPNQVDMNGGGTSSATPQAAAAAAHWLAMHKSEIKAKGEWKTWRKAEATYLAMAYTARRSWASDEPNPADQRADKFLGCGILQAKDMLGISYQQALSISGETLNAPNNRTNRDGDPQDRRLSGAPRDFYDADRSLISILANPQYKPVGPEKYRIAVDLRKSAAYRDEKQRQKALEDLHFNMLLVKEFQWGNNPTKSKYTSKNPFRLLLSGPDEPELQAKAVAFASGKEAKLIKSHRP